MDLQGPDFSDSRDPIFSDFRDPISILGTPFRCLKHLKSPVLILIIRKACNSFRTLPTQS